MSKALALDFFETANDLPVQPMLKTKAFLSNRNCTVSWNAAQELRATISYCERFGDERSRMLKQALSSRDTFQPESRRKL